MLQGKTALVTGGGSGVGAAIALALADAGAEVWISGRRREPLDAMAAREGAIRPVVGDVTDEGSVKAMFAETGKVDIVIANAGSAQSAPFGRASLDHWNAMIGVNLTGVFLTMREGYNSLRDRDWGRLIAVSSTAGLKGYAYVAAYCAAKHGVVGMVRALATEVAATGVTVNAVCPGYTQTPMLDDTINNLMGKTGRSREEVIDALLVSNPQRKLIQPAEVAQAVLWLCGPHSSPVTGQAIGLSGGETW